MKLTTFLVRIGASAGRRAESGGFRFAALTIAALALSVISAAMVAVVAVTDARADRIAEASYTIEEPGQARSDVLLVREIYDRLEEGRQFTVAYLTPVGDAPLPPGLDEWPAPGEVLLSPELRDEGAGERIEERYGEFAGEINAEALADETQLIAYVRPVEQLEYPEDYESGIEVITAFGTGDSELWNLFWLLGNQDMAAYALPIGLAVLVLVPSLLFTVVAARTSAHARDRRERLVMVLGGRPADRAWLAFGESWIPITVGSAVGALVILVASQGFRIPYADYVLSGGDLSRAWPWLALCPLLGWTVTLGAAIGLADRSRGRTTRPRPAPDSTRMVMRMALCAIAVFAAAVVAGWIPSGSAARPLLIFISIGVIIATLPSAVAVLTSWCGRQVAQMGRARGSAGRLVGGRRITVGAAAVAHQIAGLASATVLLCFCLSYIGTLSALTASTEQFVDEVGSKLVLVKPRGEHSATAAEEYRAAMGVEYGMVAAATEMDDDGEETLYVYGECRDLETLALPCPESTATEELGPGELRDPRARAMVSTFTDNVVVGRTDLNDGQERTGQLAVFRPDGGRPSLPSLKETGSEHFQLGVTADVIGGDWIAGSVPGKEQGHWVMLFGWLGLGLLALATAVGSAAEFLRSAKALAPLTTLSGGRVVFRLSSAVTVLVPMLAAVILGLIVGNWSTRVLRTMGTDLLSWEFVFTCAAAVSVVGAAMWWWASTVAIREASRWRPGRSD